MAHADGKPSKTEIDTVGEVLFDLMESDKNTQILSQRPSTDSIIILGYCLEKYVNSNHESLLVNAINFSKEYLSNEEKKMLMNMLAYIAKSDGEISEQEKKFYNYLIVEFGFGQSS